MLQCLANIKRVENIQKLIWLFLKEFGMKIWFELFELLAYQLLIIQCQTQFLHMTRMRARTHRQFSRVYLFLNELETICSHTLKWF